MAGKEVHTDCHDKCDECKEETITYFCNECEKLVCVKCVVNHKTHQFNLLDVAITNKKGELSNISDKIKKIIVVYQKIKENVKTEEHRVETILSDLEHWVEMCENTNKNHDHNLIRITGKISKQLNQWKTQRTSDPTSAFGFTQEIEAHVQDLKIIFSDYCQYSDQDLDVGSDSYHEFWLLKMDLIRRVTMKARTFMKTKYLRNVVLEESSGNGWACERGHVEMFRFSSEDGEQIAVDIDKAKCKQKIYDLAMTKSSKLLVSLTCQPGKVKKLNEAGKFERVYKAPSGYKTRGITVSDNDCIVVCLSYSSVSHSEGKVIRLSPEGHFLDVIQYELDGRTPMFQDPKLVRSNINGDLIVLDGDRRLVLIKRNGRKRSTYEPEPEKNRKIKFEGLATDANGYILISDNANSEILLLDQIGRLLSHFELAKPLVKPTGLSIGTSGKLSLLCEDSDSKDLNVYLAIFKYSIEKQEH